MLTKPSEDIIAEAADKSLPMAVQMANETPFKIKVVSLDKKNPTYALGSMIKKQNREGIQIDVWPISVKASGVLEIINDQMGFLNFRQKYRFDIDYVVYIYKNYTGSGPPYAFEVGNSVKLDSQKISNDSNQHKRIEVPLPDPEASKK